MLLCVLQAAAVEDMAAAATAIKLEAFETILYMTRPQTHVV